MSLRTFRRAALAATCLAAAFPAAAMAQTSGEIWQVLYAPGMLGNDAVNFFLDSFKRQAWLGSRLEPWAKRRNNKRRPGRATPHRDAAKDGLRETRPGSWPA